ncbi:MAG TPA: ABC transporter permease [Cyclobacteriaceae bacterium]|nr:ABC transporter permease [Cyclobacteriaceae bacterium]
MIHNYIKIAIRNISKRKLYSIVNSVGLSIGIAFSLCVYLFIQDEKSFDQFHRNKENIYLVINKRFEYMRFKNGETEPFGETVEQNGKLGEVMLEELPAVQAMTRYVNPANGLFRYRDKVFSEKLTGVDSGFFKMFSFELLAGSRDKLFAGKNDIVITPKIAEKYFGTEDPIGKTVTLDLAEERSYTVAAVIATPPANSSISYDILIPIDAVPWFRRDWDSHSYPTFVQLQEGTDIASFEDNLNKLNKKYTGDAVKQFREREKIPAEFEMEEMSMLRLPDLHFNSKVKWEKSSDPKYSWILGGIALLILVIACINYISLALTSLSTRKTEVGVRKISGAAASQLAVQFGMESIILTAISTVVAVLLVVLFLPSLNSFTERELVISLTNFTDFTLIALALTFLVGLLAGSYPAFYLSALKPALVLKGNFNSRVSAWFARPLVVLQFAISAFLIMSSIVMYQQMEFITSKDLGYNQHEVLYFPTQERSGEKSDRLVEMFRASTENDPSVVSVAGSSIPFTQGTLTLGFQDNGQPKVASGYIVDPGYISTLQIPIVAGRNFNPSNPADVTDAIIVNETLVREMKWTDPLNEHLNWHFEEGLGDKVIGVVKDHHFLSLERSIGPMFLTMDKTFGNYQYILVKVSATDIPSTLKRLESTYRELAPGKPFEYTFLDETVAQQYKSYVRWMKLMGLTTGFAIIISCLGLFGLAGTNVLNRTKEIGIRKVLGSGASDLLILLNKQYFWLGVTAFIVAALPARYVMNEWLNSFQFRIEIGWGLFAVSVLSGLVVVLLTISYHTMKAIRVNPAKTLKCE